MAVVAVVVVLDLRSPPGRARTRWTIPPIYAELKQPARGLVAEYPIEPRRPRRLLGRVLPGPPRQADHQRVHRRAACRSSARWGSTGSTPPATPGRLRTLGVRYVVAHPRADRRGVQDAGHARAGAAADRRPGSTPPSTPCDADSAAARHDRARLQPAGADAERRRYQWLSERRGRDRADGLRARRARARSRSTRQSFARPRTVTLARFGGPHARACAGSASRARRRSRSRSLRPPRGLMKVTTSPEPRVGRPAAAGPAQRQRVVGAAAPQASKPRLLSGSSSSAPQSKLLAYSKRCSRAAAVHCSRVGQASLDRVGERFRVERDQLGAAAIRELVRRCGAGRSSRSAGPRPGRPSASRGPRAG